MTAETLNIVQGEIEAVSKENEFAAGPRFCWVKLKDGDSYLANVLQTIALKPGEPIKFTCQQSRGGLQIVQILTSEEHEVSGYDGLLSRCRELVAQAKHSGVEFIKASWRLGKEISKIPRERGEGTIKKLAEDLDVGFDYLYRCIRLVERFPDADANFMTVIKSLTWRELTGPAEKKPETSALPVNPSATPAELVESYNTERKRPPTSGGKPELQTFSLLVKELNLNILYQQPVTIPAGKGHHPQSYILDFCNSAKTIDIEIDSDLHNPDDDAERDKNLKKIGIHTVRIPGSDILTTYKTIKALKKAAEKAEAA